MSTASSPSPQSTIIRTTNSNTAGAIYGLGWLASVIYFIQHATSFWMGALGVLKALIWPLLLVYKALEFFHM